MTGAPGGPPESRADAAVDVDVDVAVVGGGACGLTAALRAGRHAGLRIAVFDKDARHGANTAISSGSLAAGGTRFQAAAGISDSPEQHARDILAVSGDPGSAALVRAVCAVAPRFVEWLADDLGHPVELGIDMPRAGQSVPRLHTDPRRSGGRLLLETLRQAVAAAANVALVDRTPGVRLLTAGRAVTGVVVREGGRERAVRSRAVVLACDGFGNNPELVARYCPDAAGAFYAGASASTGDGISWGIDLGAALRCMPGYLGHGMVVARHGTRLNPNLPFLGALLVDGSGRRFCDEKAQGYSKLAGLIAALPGARAALLWDEPAMRLARNSELMRESEAAGGILRFGSAGEAAARLGIDEPALAQTVAAFESVSGLVDRPGARLGPPLYGAWITRGMLTTQGGLHTDVAGRVLRADGTPIAGLSAGGGTASGISGSSPDGYSSGNGLLAAMGLGWIIGNRLAGEL